MSNVDHANLTGSTLHEPKGVASASANTVYVADGVGSGAWSTVGLSSLASTAKAFQAQLLHVRDEKSSGTGTSAITSGAWRTRDLNTVAVNEITGASLASNQITLPAGTYRVSGSAPVVSANASATRLRNITDGSDTLIGTVEYQGNSTTRSWVNGTFTIASAKVFELQMRVNLSTGVNGQGSPGGFGVVEVYAEVQIWKIA